MGAAVMDTLACAGLAGLRKHLQPGRRGRSRHEKSSSSLFLRLLAPSRVHLCG
ncbi:MAG: hypothetical protein U1F77_03435 [Kiritimatiellia bacterium]